MAINEVADSIRRRRKRLGIKQTDLAEISGISLRTIKAIEKGNGNPTARLLEKVLEPLGLTLTTRERITHE
jgi:putative transcriptional regulator